MTEDSKQVQDDEWVGTKLLFENEVVRVWDFNLPPGASTRMHTHKRNWLFASVTGGNRLQIDYPDRDEVDHREQEDGHVSFLFVDKVADDRRTHRATNVGSEPIRQVLVEFMQSGKPA